MIHLAVALHYVNIKMFAEVCLGVGGPASRLQTTPSHLGRHASTARFPKAAVTLYISQSGNTSASKRAASAIPGPPAQVFKHLFPSRRSPFFSPLQTSPPSPHSFLTSTLPTFFLLLYPPGPFMALLIRYHSHSSSFIIPSYLHRTSSSSSSLYHPLPPSIFRREVLHVLHEEALQGC